MTLQCPLGKCQPVPIDAESVKREGWNRQGILVVSRDDQRLDWVQRESVRQIGDMLYGERKGKSMSARDLARLEAVVGILTEWAAWMQGYSPRLGYPNHSAMLSSGGNSDTFEDMCDAADAQRNQAVDSCVDDLPPDQRAAIYRRYLAAVFRMRDYETAIVLAHEALEVALRRKGMMW